MANGGGPSRSWPSPSDKEETSDIEQKKHYQQSALGVVLSPLCPAHRSLLYRMLKLAHEENLLPFPVHKPAIPTETHCCHCRFYANDDGVLPKWKALKRSSTYPSPDCHQGCESRVCHPRDFPLIGCKSISPLDLNNSCRQSCRMDTYTLVCPKRLHCTSRQGLPTDHINNTMCSFSPCSSVCCKNHPHPYLCDTNHTCVTPLKIAKEDCEPPPVLKRENSPSPPPLSPIPSNIGELKDEIPPSLLHHKQEEESFCMVKVHPGGNREVIVNAGKTKDLDFWTPKCSQTEMNPRGTSIQDVMNRFSEKLDTIKPPEKDPVMPIGEYKQEQLQFSSNGQNFQFPADAHLTEIITTVLHTRNASDYNLSELFNRHDSKDPKSPNTRLRRRQEVLAAMATPADGSTTRRQNLQIKRELAMLDVSYNRKKSSQAKSSQSKDANGAVNTYCILLDSNVIPGEERETESDMDCQTVKGVPLKMITADSNTNEVAYGKTEGNMEREIPVGENDQTNIMTRDLQGKSCNHSQDDNDQSYIKTQCDRHCQKDRVICDAPIHENAPSGQICGTDGVDNGPVEDPSHINNIDDQKSTSNESRRSRRNIVPPKRFSSYVIETRKMLFAACFSESIFNQKNPNNVYTSTTSDALLENADLKDSVLESIGKSTHLPGEFKSTNRENNRSPHIESDEQNQDMSQTLPVKAKPLEKLESHPSRPLGFNTASRRLQYTNVGVTTRSATCAKNVCIPPLQYTSPIKLMFVSPLKDKEGIIYSLKSVRSGSNGQAEEPFDPCKESSWAGTPEKDQSQKTECTTPHIRSNRKSTTSPDKSDQPSTNRSPLQKPKCGSSPAKPLFSTPKSASAPPKLNSSSFESAPSPVKSGRSSTGSGSSPVKPTSSSPKSTPGKTTSPKSSSPKIGLKRSDEVTPSKNKFGTENQRSPGDLQSFHEVTPLKRRPGRPKKLGPHLEKKVKRPIGRPRKQKPEHAATETRANEPADMEGKANRNLKITVIYGRSRRNKRLVSESFDQLQTEFRDACRAVGLKDDLSVTKISQINLCHAKLDSPESHEGIHYANNGPEAALQPSWKIKSQNRENLPSRKPGRPAKVKISGISVTITTLSPKQRKILIEKDSSNTRTNKKALLPDFQSAKEPRTVNCQPVSTNLQPEEQRESQSKSAKKVFTQPSAVRHSNRVSKPSMYFLHAVATSTTRTYRHSNALLRRSKQLLLNKACNVRKLEKQNSMGDLLVKGHHREQEHENIHQYLNQVADISVDSIFAPKETLRWWAASAEEQTLNQELARRIQLISNTWVSDALEKQTFQIKEHNEGTSSPGSNSKHSSVVQTLFNCLPAEPRSCSMQQLSSWFMETTETQSLDIVKRKSSRNRYEVMHLPRAVNKQGVKCQSPQAERLHRHLKKFAKTLPKSPVQHQKAQKRLAKTKEALSIHNLRQRLFTHKSVRGSLSQGLRRCQHLSKYQATLLRVRRRFLPQKERKWAKKRNIQETASGPEVVIGRKTKLLKSRKYKLFKSLENRSESQFEEPVGVPKEQNICSKAWSSETLKECRVFLKKINSPGNKSAEELNSCTVTLDDKSASAFVFAGKKRQLVGVVQAVKRKRRTHGMLGSAKLTDSARNSLQKLDELPLGSQKGKCPGLVSAEPPPAKKLRQSRMKGLSGPRWCDFVIGS